MTRAIEGSPLDLARWAYSSLQSRACGSLFAIVMKGKRRAEIVDSWSIKFAKIEKADPSCIVGHYRASRNLARCGVTIETIAADIEETLR